MMHHEKPRICFVAHYAYGALSGGCNGHIGGVERQISLMARWFAGRGYQVSMLTCDEGQEDGIKIDGVKVFKICRNNAGIPGLRFFWPRWSSLVAAMKRANADIYYQNCGEYVTGQVALWCSRYERKFVYSVASDPDCDVRLPEMHKLRERILYRYGLKAANKVVVQTQRQREMLWQGFGRDSIVLPMPCPGPSEDEYAKCQQERNDSCRVLWIGTIYEVKRPDRLLDLAEASPNIHFDIVGPAVDTEYARSVCRRAKTIANVRLHGPVARENVGEFYRKAKIMCCTSDFEGFPNTFLEAWSYGLPIVSTFDTDHLIDERGLGRVGKNISGLAAGIRDLLDSPEEWMSISEAARRYYRDNHALDKAMARFERVFYDVVNSVGDSRSGDCI
ncbi:glycosyltransferase family 4 protein [Planctomycetota bacterium]